jgi:energy-coupling factor transport system permease protein
MNNIALGKYIPGNSFIHKLDPRSKIMIMIILMITIFWNTGSLRFPVYFVLTAIIYILLRISGIAVKTIFKSLKPMMFMMVFLFFINAFVIQTGMPLFTISFINFTLYLDAVTQTIFIIIRLALMLAVTTILTTTTKPLDMTYGLEWYMSPLKVIRFPAHEIAMTISIALRFIPTILEETERIIKAQKSRGVDLEEGKLKEKIGAIISLLIPLLISSFQRSEELSDAMEARGYNPSAKRTRYRTLKFTMTDLISFILSAVLLTGIILLGVYSDNIAFWFFELFK